MTKAARTILVPAGPFTAIKYGIYLLLAADIFLFLREEWVAAIHTLVGPLDFRNVISSFAQTIDTAAWVVLLLLFELETFVIPDEELRGRLRWVLHGVRGTCFLLIVYAFYGYTALWLDLYAATPLPGADLCSLAPAGAALMSNPDEYVTVTAANCAALSPDGLLWQLTPAPNPVVSGTTALELARRLALADVINAGTWLLVVLLLEIDVRLQLRGLLRGWTMRISEASKGVLYSVLLACALYWGYAGSFLDFWDAFLWLLAFVLIEMNVIEWQAETTGG
ncbi:MAG: hypothetical protein HYR49_09675 [Gammaproteobacteria bacterium]|nr:hypothetical protein [Gammaproteobacteria bacterium]